MENVINKLNQWLSDEMEISSDMAFKVANATTVDKMVSSQNKYQTQKARTDAIQEAIRLVEEASQKEAI